MADFLLSPFVDAIVGKLMDSAIEEIKLVWGVEEEVEKLSITLSAIQAVLQDAEEQQVSSHAVKDWLRKLKDVAYDADDVVDEFTTEVLRSKLEGNIQTSYTKQVRSLCFSCFTSNPVKFRHEIGHKINEIWERLDKIGKDRTHFHLKQGDGGRQRQTAWQSQTSSLINESHVVGRDNDKEKILKLLLDESASSSSSSSSSSNDKSVIPIVGIGGLGKTTLAQLIYNDKRVGDHFPARGWVCISEDFDMRRVTKAIMESVTKKTCDLNEIDPLQVRLKEELSGKRFLLVLDDVWHDNPNDWQRLQSPFSFGDKGSRIIVTTRSSRVSRIMGTVSAYNLGCLNEDDSWSLFKRRAFVAGSSDVPPNLVEIGKEIVKKCNGLPLAIEALGGLLRSNTNEEKWRDILESDMWEISEMKDDQ